MPTVSLPLDLTGTSETNKVTNELHSVDQIVSTLYRVIIPTYAPLYLDNLLVEYTAPDGTTSPLVIWVDYAPTLMYVGPSRSIGKPVYGGIRILNDAVSGIVRLVSYQALGGEWTANSGYVYQQLLEKGYNPRTSWFDSLTDVQKIFPPTAHAEDAETISGHSEVLTSLDKISAAILSRPASDFSELVSQMIRGDNELRDELTALLDQRMAAERASIIAEVAAMIEAAGN